MKKFTLLITITGIALASSTAWAAPDWEKDIWPFIENSCVTCHKAPYEDERGRIRKPKAELRYDGKDFILKGGENNEDTPNLTAGDPAKSDMLARVKLPISDDDHMPPEDKADQLTDEQVKALEEWIAAGADFGDWVGATE